mgnify:CR=1 FL=1
MIKSQVPPPLKCLKPGHINQILLLVNHNPKTNRKEIICSQCQDEMTTSQRANVESLSKHLKILSTELLSTREQDASINEHLKDVYQESLTKITTIRMHVNGVLDLAQKECEAIHKQHLSFLKQREEASLKCSDFGWIDQNGTP